MNVKMCDETIALSNIFVVFPFLEEVEEDWEMAKDSVVKLSMMLKAKPLKVDGERVSWYAWEVYVKEWLKNVFLNFVLSFEVLIF